MFIRLHRVTLHATLSYARSTGEPLLWAQRTGRRDWWTRIGPLTVVLSLGEQP
jgi:hypothetical protein